MTAFDGIDEIAVMVGGNVKAFVAVFNSGGSQISRLSEKRLVLGENPAFFSDEFYPLFLGVLCGKHRHSYPVLVKVFDPE